MGGWIGRISRLIWAVNFLGGTNDGRRTSDYKSYFDFGICRNICQQDPETIQNLGGENDDNGWPGTRGLLTQLGLTTFPYHFPFGGFLI